MANFWDTTGGQITKAAGGVALSAVAPTLGIPLAAQGISGLVKNKKLNPKLNPRQVMVEQLAAEANALRNNPQALGLTGAEKRQMVDATAQQAGAQRQGAITQLSRDALAGQGFQQGAFQQAASDIAGGAAADVASAQAAAEQMSNQKIEQARARITGELAMERDRRKANREYYMQFGLDGFEAFLEAQGAGG